MAGPQPEVAAARLAVRRSLADLRAGSTVLVACSGGPDSTALAAATAFVAPRAGMRAGAVVVDHGLQPGSAEVAATAAGTCRRLGLEPVLVTPVRVGTEGGPEAAARAARYAALEAAAETVGARAVLLGHTLDDQAETVLLRLARGSGARSLAGMPARRGVFRRPFLGLRRSALARVCEALDLPVWRDPTNDDGALRRAAVRRDVLPALERALGPGAVPALARSAELLRADADELDRQAEAALAGLAEAGAAGGVGLDVAGLAALPGALRGRVLRAAALRAGSPPGALGAGHVRAVERLVSHYHGQGEVALPGGITARRGCGRLTLSGPAGAQGARRAGSPDEDRR